MNHTKHILKKCFIAGLLMISTAYPAQLFATHIIGAEIRYECLGNNQYKIILDVYRDCFYGAAGFDSTAYVAAYDANGAFIINLNLNMHPILPTDTIPNNISNDPCLLPPSDVCVETARYEKTVTINQTGGIYIVYQRCCRNQSIANIVDPLNSGSTYFVYISPESRALCNSSPEFGFYPPIFVCVNKEINHEHQATDPEGDSLVYKFYTPFLGATQAEPQPGPGDATPPPYDGDTVIWSPGYGLNNLLGNSNMGSGTLSIDPHTGLITGFPMISGQFVVGVSVEEYRNGQLLSVVRRDFQYNVGECVQVDATIEAPSAQCDDLTVSILNLTDGPENYLWYFDWPNPTPTSTVKQPVHTYPDTGSYTIALIVAPGFQCVDTAFHDIFLQYNSLTPDFTFQTFDCTDQSVLVLEDQSVDPVSPPVEWNWTVDYGGGILTSNEQNPVLTIPNPSSGTITLVVRSQNGCEQVKTDNFTSGGNNPVDLLPDTVRICIGEAAELNPNGPVTGFTYQWGPPVPANQQNLANPVVSPQSNTTYPVTITGFNGLCQSEAEVAVEVSPAVSLDFEADTDCDARVVHFINQSTNAFQGYSWNFGDPSTVNDVSAETEPTYIYPDYGTYTVTLATAPDAICKDTITREVTIEEKILDADFSIDYTACEEDQLAIRFFDESVNNQFNTVEWQWIFSGIYNDTSTLQSPTIIVNQEGILNVTLTITTDEACTSATAPQSLNIDLTELPGLDSNQVLGCLNGGVTLNPGGDPGYLYNWTPATGLSCTDCPSPFANPSQTTTYTVQVYNISADTCEITRQVTVNVPDNVGLIASDDVLTCDSTATLQASTALQPVTIAWFNENGTQVAGNVTSITVDVSGSMNYVVRATDQVGCHYYDTVNVAGGTVDIQAVGDIAICSDESLDVFATNLDNNDTLTWQWTPVNAFSGPTNVPDPDLIIDPGPHTLTVEAFNQFGCSVKDTVQVDIVDVNNNLDFDFVVTCSGSQVDFINQSTNAFNFIWDFGDPTTTDDVSNEDNPTYTYPDNGTYLVSLTMDFDLECVDTITKPVEIAETQFVAEFGFDYLDCTEDSMQIQFLDSTQILVNNIDVVGWNWSTSEGDTSTLQNPIFTIFAGQELDVTMIIETSNGCTGIDSRTVKLEFIESNLADTIVLCPGDSTFINPLGNTSYAYNWFPNQSISDPTAVNPLVYPDQTTTYSVQITNFDPDTCNIVREVVVFVPEKISLQESNDTLTCGGPVQLSVAGNVSPLDYIWTAQPGGFAGSGSTITPTPPVDTWYQVVATDQYECVDSAQVFVANEAINATLNAVDNACPETELTLSVINNVGDHLINYQWTSIPPGGIVSGGTTATPTVLSAPANSTVTYTVDLENQFGCQGTLSETVSSLGFIPTVVDSIQICAGVPTAINPGANPLLTYQWSPATGLSNPAAANPVATLSQTTFYTVTVSDAFGFVECEEVFDVEVFVPTIIDITETVDTFSCGDPITIGASVNVPVTLEWLDGQGNSLGNNNQISVNPATSELYIINVIDNFGCTASDTVEVTNNELDIVLDGQGVIDTCPMPSYNICINNLDPNDILTYSWEPADGNGTILSGEDSACPEVSTVEGTVAVFTVEVANQYGCMETDEVEVTTYVFDPVIRDLITICPDTPTPINEDAAGSDLSYSWQPQIGLDCYDCPNPVATLSQNQQYTVTILGYNGADTCSLLQTVGVNVNPFIELSTTPDQDTSLCQMGAITFGATVGSGIVTDICWFESDLTTPLGCGNELTVTPDETEMFFAVATDTLGCMDTSSVTVNAYPIDVALEDFYNFCEVDETLTITAVNNDPAQQVTYTWSPTDFIIDASADNSSIVVDNVPEVSVFTVSLENQYGCTAMDSTTVFYYDIEPTVGDITSSEDTIYYNSGEFSQLMLDIDASYMIEWIPQDGLDDPFVADPIAEPLETTTYMAVVTDEGGCVAEREVTIVVINPDCQEPNIFLPNAFTPNGDGENDVLYVRSNIIDEMELSIYNRWGELVFRTTDQTIGWDGTYKNERLEPDLFGVLLTARCFNGQEYTKKGNVMILR